MIAKKKSPDLEKLSEKMISLNSRLAELGDKRTDGRVGLEDEIRKTDDEINQAVYVLYGITDEEKKIIENCYNKIVTFYHILFDFSLDLYYYNALFYQ